MRSYFRMICEGDNSNSGISISNVEVFPLCFSSQEDNDPDSWISEHVYNLNWEDIEQHTRMLLKKHVVFEIYGIIEVEVTVFETDAGTEYDSDYSLSDLNVRMLQPKDIKFLNEMNNDSHSC